MVGKIPIIFFLLLLLDACDGGVARQKYEVIKEGWFNSERAPLNEILEGVRGEEYVNSCKKEKSEMRVWFWDKDSFKLAVWKD